MRLLFLLLVLTVGTAGAQETVTGSVVGQIQIDNEGVFACQASGSLLCASCVQDSDDPGSIPPLIISFGRTGLSGWSYGTLTGSLSLELEVDGLVLPPDLLPCDSWFSSRIGVGAGYVPNSPCGAQGLDYTINSNVGLFTEGGNQEITIPVEEADLVQFEINFCNVSAHWGAGCNVNGSVNDRWVLHAAGPMNAAEAGAGDPGPLDFPGVGATVDFASGAGGLVSAMFSEMQPPHGPAPVGTPGYWEIKTDMEDGAYEALVTLRFDAEDLPSGMEPDGLMIARYDHAEGGWQSLESTVDFEARTVSASTNELSKFVLTTMQVVEAKGASWGALKGRY